MRALPGNSEAIVYEGIAIHAPERLDESIHFLRKRGGDPLHLPGENAALLVVQPPAGGSSSLQKPGKSRGVEKPVERLGDLCIVAQHVVRAKPPLERGGRAGPNVFEGRPLHDATKRRKHRRDEWIAVLTQHQVDRTRGLVQPPREFFSQPEQRSKAWPIVSRQEATKCFGNFDELGAIEPEERENGAAHRDLRPARARSVATCWGPKRRMMSRPCAKAA